MQSNWIKAFDRHVHHFHLFYSRGIITKFTEHLLNYLRYRFIIYIVELFDPLCWMSKCLYIGTSFIYRYWICIYNKEQIKEEYCRFSWNWNFLLNSRLNYKQLAKSQRIYKVNSFQCENQKLREVRLSFRVRWRREILLKLIASQMFSQMEIQLNRKNHVSALTFETMNMQRMNDSSSKAPKNQVHRKWWKWKLKS